MEQERWRRADEIFHSALKLDGQRRAGFLEQTCSDDNDLRAMIERLLMHYTEAATFLEQPAIQLVANAGAMQLGDPAMEGEIVLHYRVGAKLGNGGMGVVYEAEDLKLGRKVALKFLYSGVRGDDDHAMKRLQAEARTASKLNHPNICTIYAIEEYGGRPVLVMELLDGEDLRQRVRAAPVSVQELIRTGMQACEALGAAHGKGIVHRDIKPANIFATNDGRLKLLDFGVAKWIQAAEPDAGLGNVAGTIPYMSPEQLRGEEIDGRSDVFSLGVVLYELATGIRPFERSDALLTMEAVLHDSAVAPSSVNPALPSSLARVITQMLEKDREQRYHSAADVSKQLMLLDQSRWGARKKWKLAGAAAALLVLCVIGAIFFGRRPAPAFTAKDTIVLADFANQTGDPTFNETLRSAFALELRQSPFLSLISDERIRHVLGLMGKSPDKQWNTETAREVCERTESAAVLDGGIATSGEHYVISLHAQNCRTGESLYSDQAEAARKDVLRTIAQLADKFRKRAGESLIAMTQHSNLISDPTTPSLEAWRLYSEGMKLGMLQGHAVAIPFLKRAIQIDPHFATALALLGRDYSALGEMELAREYTRRAFRERDRASDQEKFFIDYSYDRLVTGDLEKALRTSENWTRTYPRDVLGHALFGAAAKVVGRFDKSVEENKKSLEVDPDQPYPYAHLAMLAVFRNDYAEAQRWLERAADRKLTLPDYSMIRYQMAFLQANQTEMERMGIAAEGMSEIQDWIWGERGQVLAFSGDLQQAREMSRRAVQVALAANRKEAAAQHEAAAAVREALFGNAAEARKRAAAAQKLSRGKDAQYGAALAFGFSGDSMRAEILMKDLEQRYPDDTIVRFSFVPSLRALAAIHRGEGTKALELLDPAARYELGWLGCCSIGFVGSLYPIYVRGEAYLALHQSQEAAVEFQKILDNRGIAGSNPIALLAHWKKGQALAMAGKRAEAEAEYQKFLSLWREADADVPILRNVKAEYARLLAEAS